MAPSVSFFSRLSNLWKGFVSLWISDLEKEHPEIAYENAINSMIEKYSQLKRATAAARGAEQGVGPDRGRPQHRRRNQSG